MPGLSADENRLLVEEAGALGVYLSSTQLQALGRFLDVLGLWMRRHRLVGTRDRATLLVRHMLDCLAPASLLATREKLVDIGSGAGLPGVPLAVACPGLKVTLVDSRHVPVNFLRDVVRTLGLRNAEILQTRIEALAEDPCGMGAFDATIARAWSGLKAFLDVSAPLLRSGGIAIAMKGPGADQELSALADLPADFHVPERHDYELTRARARRTLLIFSRR